MLYVRGPRAKTVCPIGTEVQFRQRVDSTIKAQVAKSIKQTGCKKPMVSSRKIEW
jgi:hypothetical protein